jgi:hypothetical protein
MRSSHTCSALAEKRAMRLLPAIAMALVLARPAEPVFCETQPNLPSPTFVLHIPSLRVAEMSPDEKYLAAIVVHWSNGVPLTAELQLWDFRRGTLLQAHSLPVPEARPEYPRGTSYLHYTSDGQLLAVYTGGDLLHVLRATDLQDVRTVAVQSHANINAFEVSPTGHRVAMCMSREIRVYDLDSGEEIQSWRINPHSEEWHPAPLLQRLYGKGSERRHAGVERLQILFTQRASPAFLGPEYLLFGQIELAYNELVSLLQVGLTCVSYVVSHQL